MLAQVITENGQKKIIPLTADAGAGNPVGTIIPMYKKSSPSGYLYCDGSTFDETLYPLLYAYLGSNVLPDYREFALVGAEENTTDVYNASTNPNGTIHDHDVFTQGQAKDDQLQDHDHNINPNPNLSLMAGKQGALGNTDANIGTVYHKNTGNISTGRAGTVTRGKRKAVYFYIKATSGLTEGQQDDVANIINEERSYSTSEINTGKKWIDGKPIYRKVVDFGALPNASQKTVNHGISNLGQVIKCDVISTNGSSYWPLPYASLNSIASQVTCQVNSTTVQIATGTNSSETAYFIIEYTKTT